MVYLLYLWFVINIPSVFWANKNLSFESSLLIIYVAPGPDASYFALLRSDLCASVPKTLYIVQ